MKEISTSEILISTLKAIRQENKGRRIGLVPTMGALHEGHLSLIKACKERCDVVVCSIFVNPTQFNNPDDLEKYPRKESEDMRLLEKEGCDFVYLPSVEDIYPNGKDGYTIDLGVLDEVMEGKYRPNHFDGVAMVVERFFEIVQPDFAFFGEKDFQQLAVVRRMTALRKLEVTIVPVETVRSTEGLALSSRNLRLNEEQQEDALIIYQTMMLAKQLKEQYAGPKEARSVLLAFFEKSPLALEYLEIVDEQTFLPASEWKNARICISAYCEQVRLIDNMAI